MELKTIIYTTARRRWIERDFDAIIAALSAAKGVTVAPFEVRQVELPATVPTYKDAAGGVYIDWEWLKTFCPSDGFNAVGLHLSRSDRTRLGLKHPDPTETLGGVYHSDRDGVFDFVVIADEKTKAYKGMSSFERLVLHELGGHGFSNWLGVPDRTHEADYANKDIKAYIATLDFTRWNVLKTLATTLPKLADTMRLLSERAMYPVPNFRSAVTQKWAAQSDLYASGYHFGLDVAAKIGDPVRAPQKGRVYLSGYTAQLGYHLFFETEINDQTHWYLFCHLSHMATEREYKKGEVLGTIGNTGLSTGPHMHVSSFREKPRSVTHYVSLVDTYEKGIANTLDPEKEFAWLVDRVIP